MVVDGINKWAPSRKAGGILTRFNLTMENERAAAGRDGRTLQDKKTQPKGFSVYTDLKKKNLNASRPPSEHPPVRGENVKTFS